MLQLFPDLCYHMGAIRKMGGYQRVKMSRRLSEGGIVVGGGGGRGGQMSGEGMSGYSCHVFLNGPVFATCPSFLTITFR